MSQPFVKDSLSSSFFDNASFSLTIFSFSFGIYYSSLIISKILHQITPSTLNNLGSLLGGSILIVRQKCTKLTNNFTYSGLIRITTVNFYELAFSSLYLILYISQLYFNYNQYQNLILFLLLQTITNVNFSETTSLINNIGAIATLTFQIAFISVLFHKIRQIQTKKTTDSKFSIKTLFQQQDNSGNQKLWVMQYNTLLLVKKVFYISVIVGMQETGLYQTIAVALQSSVFCAYLIVLLPLIIQSISQPFAKVDDLRKVLVTEAGMFFNSLSFILYSVQQQFSFTQETLFYLGWINIGTYTIIISSNTLIDTFNQFKIIYTKIKKKLNSFIQSQLPSQSRIQPIFV